MAEEPGIRSDLYNLGAEIESSFNTRNGGPSWPNIQAYDCTYSLQQEALDDGTARAERGANPPVPGTMSNSTLSCSIYPTGLQTEAGDGVTAAATVHGPIWKAAMGDEVLAKGTQAVTGSPVTTATEVNVTADSPDIEEGTIAIFTTSGGLEPAMVSDVEVDGGGVGKNRLTLVNGLSSVPTDTSEVFATASYQFSGTGPASTVQFRLANMSDENSFEAYGGGCEKWSIASLEPGALMTAAFDFKLGSFELDDGVVGDPTISAPSLLTKSPWMDSRALLWDWSASPVTYSADHLRPLKTFAADFTLGISPRRDPNLSNGIGGWNPGGDPVGTVTLTTVLDYAWQEDWDAYESTGTPQYYGMLVSTGSVAGRIWGVYLDKVHLTAQPTNADANGILVTTLNLALSSDAGSNTGSSNATMVVFSG